MEAQEILVIVSNPNGSEQLETRPEIQAIMRAHGRENVTILYNPTRIEIAEAVGNGDFSIMHFAGHCSANGFLLKDGDLPPSAIASYALSMTPKLRIVILNSCESDGVANAIAAESNIDVVYTESKVEDAECIDFAILFHTKLRSPTIRSFLEAYNLVDPSGVKFKYKRSSAVGMDRNLVDTARLERIEKAIEEIREYLIGSLHAEGLGSEFKRLRIEVGDHNQRLAKLESRGGSVSERDFYIRMALVVIVVSTIVYFIR